MFWAALESSNEWDGISLRRIPRALCWNWMGLDGSMNKAIKGAGPKVAASLQLVVDLSGESDLRQSVSGI